MGEEFLPITCSKIPILKLKMWKSLSLWDPMEFQSMEFSRPEYWSG